MDNYIYMILACGAVGIGMSLASPLFGIAAATMGPIIAVLPGIMIYMAIWRSGMLNFIAPQKRGEVLVFYTTPMRRIYPLKGREGIERYIKLDSAYGRIRVTANSDYTMMGKKVVIARQGTAHTVPMDMAEKTQELRQKGAKNLAEATEIEKGAATQEPKGEL